MTSEAAQAAYPDDTPLVVSLDILRVAYDRGVADTEARLAVEPEQVADPSGDPYPWVWSGHSPFNRMRADTDKYRAGASDMLYLPRPEFAVPEQVADRTENAAEIAKAQAEAVTEAAVIEWMGRHSSAVVSRVVEHGQKTLDERFADGVFE